MSSGTPTERFVAFTFSVGTKQRRLPHEQCVWVVQLQHFAAIPIRQQAEPNLAWSADKQQSLVLVSSVLSLS